MNWTAEAVRRQIEKAERARPRVEAVQWVKDSFALAERHYANMHARVTFEYDRGIVGFDRRRPKWYDRDAWIAAEVRDRLLKELDAETPYRRNPG